MNPRLGVTPVAPYRAHVARGTRSVDVETALVVISWVRRAAGMAIVAAPAAIGAGVAIAWASGDAVPLVDPVSVAGLGLVGTAAGISNVVWRRFPTRGRPPRNSGDSASSEQDDGVRPSPMTARWLITGAWGTVAVLVAWVVANRIVGVSTGSVRPGFLLIIGAVVVGIVLAACTWGTEWGRQVNGWSLAVARDPDLCNVRFIATIAAVVRLTVLFRVPVFVIGDSGVYVEAAGTIARNGSFGPLLGIYPPAYSIFLAIVCAVLGPDFLGPVAVQHALGIITSVATYRVARVALPPGWALVPALATAMNGYLLILEHGIYTEALFVPLLVVVAWMATRLLGLVGSKGWLLAAATGALMAIASLTRLVLQPFLMVLAGAMLIADGWPPRHDAWRRVAVLIGAFVVTVSPWLVHNIIVHRYVGLSNGTGVSALLPRLWEEEATYAWANPAHPDPIVRSVTIALQDERDHGSSYWQAYLRVQRDFPGLNASNLVAAAGIDVIVRHPALFVDRTWFRWRRLWAGGFARETVNDLYGEQEKLRINSPIFMIRPDGPPESELAGNQAHVLTRLVRPDDVPPGLTLVLTVVATVASLAVRRLRPALVPIGLGLGLLFLAVLLNSDRARYRHPAEPFLVVTYTVGAYALWQATRWMRERVRGTLSTLPGQDLTERIYRIPRTAGDR